MSDQPNPNPTPTSTTEPALTKSALKKLEKERKKKELKDKRLAEQQQKQQKTVSTSGSNFGVLPLICSQVKTGTKWTNIREINESLKDTRIRVRGRIHNSRGKGNLCFVVLRQGAFSIQVVLSKSEVVSKDMLNFVQNVTRESIVDVVANVTIPTNKIESTTQQNVELVCSEFWVVSTASTPLPFIVSDAEIPQPLLDAQAAEIEAIDSQIAKLNLELETADATKKTEIEENIKQLTTKKGEAQKYPSVSQVIRLDNRVIDLRTTANQAIFRIQSGAGTLFREYLLKLNFIEIHSPKIIAAASEGGAGVFKLEYFSGNAFLAQSPQLYKQMAICGDFDRVFEVAPVFRAENANTHRHLTEFVGLDLEMSFNEHYHEVLEVIDSMFIYIWDGLKERFAEELAIIKRQYPFEDLVYTKPGLRLTYIEAVDILKQAGEELDYYDDIDTRREKLLGQLVKNKYNTDYFYIDKFPSAIRPFYTMDDPLNNGYANAYDFFLRGEEICSGAQRIHDATLLEEKARKCGVAIPTIQSYIDSFKFGALPHAGGGVGLERIAMFYLGLKNIRKTSLFPRDPSRLTP
eukprot:TRINITY_DN1101_c0_g1_i1.p1 TRINITY_DN1101_c0_g1~~TRINITY_DN1101_c0_g1_i1.p1  ORF type:complete len:576 (-),score=299.67 TRINITY_DN1101_c0_g1_i1:139-1866(-)